MRISKKIFSVDEGLTEDILKDLAQQHPMLIFRDDKKGLYIEGDMDYLPHTLNIDIVIKGSVKASQSKDDPTAIDVEVQHPQKYATLQIPIIITQEESL